MVDPIIVGRLEDDEPEQKTSAKHLEQVDVSDDDAVITAVQGERIVLVGVLRDAALSNDQDAQRLYLEALKHTADTAVKRKTLSVAEKGLDATMVSQLVAAVMKGYNNDPITVEGEIPTPSKGRLTDEVIPKTMLTYDDSSRTDSYKSFMEDNKDLSIIEVDEKDKD